MFRIYIMCIWLFLTATVRFRMPVASLHTNKPLKQMIMKAIKNLGQLGNMSEPAKVLLVSSVPFFKQMP